MRECKIILMNCALIDLTRNLMYTSIKCYILFKIYSDMCINFVNKINEEMKNYFKCITQMVLQIHVISIL